MRVLPKFSVGLPRKAKTDEGLRAECVCRQFDLFRDDHARQVIHPFFVHSNIYREPRLSTDSTSVDGRDCRQPRGHDLAIEIRPSED